MKTKEVFAGYFEVFKRLQADRLAAKSNPTAPDSPASGRTQDMAVMVGSSLASPVTSDSEVLMGMLQGGAK